MFDNLGTALVQALGFFAVFGFFVYQTLFADKSKDALDIGVNRGVYSYKLSPNFKRIHSYV